MSETPGGGRAQASTARPTGNAEGRDEILSAAAHAFMERGYTATTIDDIADRLGATKGRVYHYYRSKADIFLDINRYGMRLMLERVGPLARGGGTASERLHAMAREHARLMMSSLPFQRVSVQGVERHLAGRTTDRQRSALEGVVRMRDEYEGLYVSVLEEGLAAGEFRPLVPRIVSKAMLGSLNWITVWYRPRPGETDVDREGIAEEVARFVTQGLRR